MKLFISLAFLCCSSACSAQESNLDIASIKKNNTDKTSALYYPDLAKRYNADDTMLTTEQYGQLYYGSAFMPGYEPYGNPDDELKQLRPIFAKEKLDDKDLDEAIRLERSALKSYPYRLSTINYLAELYSLKNDTARSKIMYAKLLGFIRCMTKTGNAQSDSSAMYVINVDDEYTIIRLIGLEFAGDQALISYKGHSMDKMKLEDNDTGLKYLYFNVDILFKAMTDIMDKGKN